MNPIQVVRFSQIANLLSEGCWAKQRSEKHGGKFGEEWVLHIRGDARFSTLDLDEVTKSIPVDVQDGNRIFLILVEGNLTAEAWLGNENTDGATNLIIKGDLQAQNALLGGQQVYVCGNMSIEDILWGDYNHGELIVEGTTEAGLLIVTNQYHYDLRGERRFMRQLIEEIPGGGDWDLMDFETLSKLVEPDCLLDDANLEHVALMRDVVFDRLKRGEAVLRRAALSEEILAVPPRFTDRGVTIDNILELANPKRMPADIEGKGWTKLEFWTDDTLCRVMASGQETEFGALRMVYLQNDTHAMAIKVVLEEDPRSLWQKLSGKLSAGTWRMRCEGRRFHAHGDEDWHVIGPESRIGGGRAFPEEFHSLLATGWNALLDGISTYDHAKTWVDPKEIRRLLALPVAEPYDDFWGDACGFWSGHLFCAFRQEGALHDDEPQPALLRVSREYTNANGRDLIEMYFFSIRNHPDGKESVFITYKYDEDSDAAQVPISLHGGRHLELARRAFNVARRNLDEANRALIEDGVPPNWDDDFAIKHWKQQGFIRLPRPAEPDRKFSTIEKTTSQPIRQARSPVIEELHRHLELLGFHERILPDIVTGNSINAFVFDAEREAHRLSASLIERDNNITLDISFYFDVDDWKLVRSDLETTIAGVLDNGNPTNALFALPEKLHQLEAQTAQQAATLIELSVPEREPDQTFEIVTVSFTRDLPSRETKARELDNVQRDRPDASAQDDFLHRIGWDASALPAWQINISFATRAPIEWTTKRNALQSDDMWLSLTLSSFSPWKVQLERHDRLFITDWTDRGVMVESAQLRYRKLMKWPQIADPADLPRLVVELTMLLSARFSRVALITLPRADEAVKQAFAAWLSNVCDTIEFIGDDE